MIAAPLDYGHALASISILSLIAVVLGPLASLRKFKDGVRTGAMPEPDYKNSAYRMNRAYLNLVENMPWFLGACFAAMFVGASPVSVNWLASLFLLFRLAHLVVHIGAIGKTNLGLRSYVYTGASLCTAGLALLTLYTVFLGG